VRLGKPRHRRRRERLDLESLDRLRCRELPEHEPKGVGAVELVVPVAGENECVSSLDPASEQLQDVERGLVRPVQILDHEDGRRVRSKLVYERGGDVVWSGPSLDEALEVSARATGAIQQRPKRPRREESVAGALQDSRRSGALLAKTSRECCLSNAGLAGDKAKSTAAVAGVRERVVELLEKIVPFEQVGRVDRMQWNEAHHSYDAPRRRGVQEEVPPRAVSLEIRQIAKAQAPLH
jgi:hypothetical protein